MGWQYSQHPYELFGLTPQALSIILEQLECFSFVGEAPNIGSLGPIEFKLHIEFSSEAGLLDSMKSLGIELQKFPPDVRQPIPGKSYSMEEAKSFPTLISSPLVKVQHLGQPCHVKINNEKCFVWVDHNYVSVSIGGLQPVTTSLLQSAKNVDSYIRQCRFKLLALDSYDPYRLTPEGLEKWEKVYSKLPEKDQYKEL